mmetsp:Transcript_10404/g.33247  ORF Transcript_10404/g.33247 Transcript_10404/m.33247 type:complete len:223 (-) Transcript_10404:176-844(-)
MADQNEMQAAAHKLLETDRYNKAVLPELTKCVHAQVEQGWYDAEINMAILKLYQFHPDPNQGIVEPDVLVKILALALMRVPEADFKLCLYLIPEQYQNIDSVTALTKLAEKLEVCQFAAFWDLLGKKAEVLAIVPGLESALRRTIFNTLALTFQEIPAQVFSNCLNCSVDRALEDFEGLKQDGNKVILPKSANNSARPAGAGMTAQTDMQLPQLAQVLSNTL